MRARQNAFAFTLTEVLVSLVLVVIISATSWLAIGVLGPTHEASRNRLKAENLLTKSQEEVLRISQSRFATLESCDFKQPNNICGFSDISLQFPEFAPAKGGNRTLLVTDVGSPELKRAHVTVSWTEFGVNKILDSVLLLARPPDPLPGNLVGLVTRSDTNATLDKVIIKITSGPSSPSATTGITLPINYDFAEAGTGRFLLKPGIWSLSATRAGFTPVTINAINISSNIPSTASFSMVPLPAQATISGRVVNGGSVLTLNGQKGSTINLYEKGGVINRQKGNLFSNYNFAIPFVDVKPRCFTLATTNSFRSNFAGNINCDGFALQAQGWSSAKIDNKNSPTCANAWVGDAASDRICVNPGDNKIQDIPLVPVPTGRIQGTVVDGAGVPIKGASIILFWHDGTSNWGANPAGVTDGLGQYDIVAPAEQEMFPNQNGFYPMVQAQIDSPYTSCCNTPATQLAQSAQIRAGAVFAGQTVTAPLIKLLLFNGVQDCGNAAGTVHDDKSGGVVDGATIGINNGGNQPTDGLGNYIYQCPDPAAFRIPVENSNVLADHPAYYAFNSAGNIYYNPTFSIAISKQTTTPVPDIGLWPIGRGTVSGTVKIGAGPGVGITVNLNLGTGGKMTAVTDGSGAFKIDNVPETWPPPGVANNGKYKHTVRWHDVTIKATAQYDAYSSPEFELDAGTEHVLDIVLLPPDAF